MFFYVSSIHLLLLKQKYEISPFRSAPVEMTCWEILFEKYYDVSCLNLYND